ncbi:MAG: response regulator [Cyclobacteriaceae bacterium]|nr:response regulator [Cyclobacteriaceae bacterium]MCX7637341.1 response regulator [Cyclobacteriaceae bacterium]MDW8330424.1 response regulator [Cyclobacteriaceae bacterium]
MMIHLIEDDDIYAEFIQRSLAQDPDIQVKVFRTAEDCLNAVNGGPLPDAFIVDYKLPGKSGIEFYEAIKSRLKENNKLIMMSAIDDGAMVLNFIRKGVRDYVIKDDNVIESLKAILEGKDEDYYLFN